jgi:large subunit ribosomal protein L3
MSDSNLSTDVIVGQKAGMTRIFDQDGNFVPVTVIKLIPNKVVQVKSKEKDGYSAYKVAFYEKRQSLVSAPVKGMLKKAGVDPVFTKFFEIKTDSVNPESVGKELTLDLIEKSKFVDVTGISKGKGFQGVMKRYGFAGGPAAHGSQFHRRPGSIGNRATPARVFAQKKMPGHMGSEKVTVQNLSVVEINKDKGYLLLKGAVPGSKNGFVKITTSTKKKGN